MPPVPSLQPFALAPLLRLPEATPPVRVAAKDLWSTRHVAIAVIRRPGCILCRAEALKLHTIKDELDTLGVSLVAVLHEALPEQVNEFKSQYWPGELYLDETKSMYAAVGGAAKDEVPTSNLIGEGTHLGGLLLVRKGSGDVVFGFQEKTFGDYAPPADVLKAAKSL